MSIGASLSDADLAKIKYLVNPEKPKLLDELCEVKDELVEDITSGVRYLADTFIPNTKDSWLSASNKLSAGAIAGYGVYYGAYQAAPQIAMLLAKGVFFGSVGVLFGLSQDLSKATHQVEVENEKSEVLYPLIYALQERVYIENGGDLTGEISLDHVNAQLEKCIPALSGYISRQIEGESYLFSKKLIQELVTTIKTSMSFAKFCFTGTKDGSELKVSFDEISEALENCIREVSLPALAVKLLDEQEALGATEIITMFKELASHLGRESNDSYEQVYQVLLRKAFQGRESHNFCRKVNDQVNSLAQKIDECRSLDTLVERIQLKDQEHSFSPAQVQAEIAELEEMASGFQEGLLIGYDLLKGNKKLLPNPAANDGINIQMVPREGTPGSQDALFKQEMQASFEASSIEVKNPTPPINLDSKEAKKALLEKMKKALLENDESLFFAAHTLLPEDAKNLLYFHVYEKAGNPQIDDYGEKTIKGLEVASTISNLAPWSHVLNALDEVISLNTTP